MNNGVNNMQGQDPNMMGYGQPMMNQNNMYGNPNYQQPQKKKGIVWKIILVVIILAVIAFIVFIWPHVKADLNLIGTWNCDNDTKFTFTKDDKITASTTEGGVTYTFSGSFELENGDLKDDSLKKDGYTYVKLEGIYEKVTDGVNSSAYNQNFTIVFGSKGKSGHLIINNNMSSGGTTCTKE